MVEMSAMGRIGTLSPSSVRPMIPFVEGRRAWSTASRKQQRIQASQDNIEQMNKNWRLTSLSSALANVPESILQHYRGQTNGGSRLFGVLAALIVGLTGLPGSAQANNVRVEDVENPIMQSGLMAANEGRFTDAESFFKIYLRSDGESASAWSNLGNVHLSLGRPLEAVDDFSTAIRLAPDAPVPYLNRALAKEALGVDAYIDGYKDQATQFYNDALQDCEGATQRDPKEFAAWFNKGNIELRLELFKEALVSYTKAADLAPGISGYRLREAELMFQEGKIEQSDKLMRGVVRKYPYYAEAHAALAAVQWSNGKASLAEDNFNAATQLEPGWMSMSYIRNNTRWPPLLYDAMQKFLSMSFKAT